MKNGGFFSGLFSPCGHFSAPCFGCLALIPVARTKTDMTNATTTKPPYTLNELMVVAAAREIKDG